MRIAPCPEVADPPPAAGLLVVRHGVRVAVRVDDPAVAAALAGRLPPAVAPGDRTTAPPVDDRDGQGPPVDVTVELTGRSAAGPGTGPAELRLDGEVVRRAASAAALLDEAERAVRLAVAARAERVTFVHAGVVVLSGRAVLLPGVSGAGKTELVRALLAAGAAYGSDEYAPIDAAGRVWPYPRPLSVRTRDGRSRRSLDPAALGAPTVDGPVPVGLVVVTRHRPGARWRPRPAPPGAVTLALLANTVPVTLRPGRTVAALAALARAVPAAASERAEAGPAARTIIELLRTTALNQEEPQWDLKPAPTGC